MATSTRRTFTAGRGPNARPTANVSTRVSQSVARRAQSQIAAAQQRPNAPALAAPGGLVQRPGGEPLRPRARQSTGATPVGAAVQYNQGIATGQPFTPSPEQVRFDLNRAILVEADPNGTETAPRITPRSVVDISINTANNSFWYWENSESQWVAAGTALVVADAAPVDAPDSAQTIWIDRIATTAYTWDADAETPTWIGPIGGGGTIIYGNGNPNGTLASQASAVPWVANGQYYDKSIQRLYVAWDFEDSGINWVPASTHTFDADSLGDSGVYPGDMYQGSAAHGIVGAEGGMLYRLSSGGSWVPQFTCCDDIPEPPPDPCTPGYLYGSGAIAAGATQIYYPC